VCLATNGGTTVDNDGNAHEVAATEAFVEVLDAADGQPLAHWAAPLTAQTLALVDGDVILGATHEASDEFTSHDLLTGEQHWSHVVPIDANPFPDDASWRTLNASRAGDLISVRTSLGEVQLLGADGRVLRDKLGDEDGDSWGVQLDPSGRYILESWGQESISVVVLSSDLDPDKDRTLAGQLVRPGVDDGSEPNLMLTADSSLARGMRTPGSNAGRRRTSRWSARAPSLRRCSSFVGGCTWSAGPVSRRWMPARARRCGRWRRARTGSRWRS